MQYDILTTLLDTGKEYFIFGDINRVHLYVRYICIGSGNLKWLCMAIQGNILGCFIEMYINIGKTNLWSFKINYQITFLTIFSKRKYVSNVQMKEEKVIIYSDKSLQCAYLKI